jgi:hypothetical protein
VSIVDLHDIKLLNNLGINFQLLLLKGRNDILAQVYRDDIMQYVEGFYLFVSLQQNISKTIGHLRFRFLSPFDLRRSDS